MKLRSLGHVRRLRRRLPCDGWGSGRRVGVRGGPVRGLTVGLAVAVAVAAASCGGGADSPAPETTEASEPEAVAGVTTSESEPVPSSSSVVASTAPPTSTTEPDLDPTVATEADYVEALALSALSSQLGTPMSEEQAFCLAEGQVAVLGIDRIRAVGGPKTFVDALDDDVFERSDSDAGQLAPMYLQCWPELGTLVASSFAEAGGGELTDSEMACVGAATEPALVTTIAHALSDEFPSVHVMSEPTAIAVAADLLECSPAIREFWRSGFLEGIELASDLGFEEPAAAHRDCMLEFLDDDLIVEFMAVGLRREGGLEDRLALVENTVAAVLEACPAQTPTVFDDQLQGFVITKTVAEQFGITHLDQINDDPELTALFDSDGDGDAEIFGCMHEWRCDDVIESMIAFNSWTNIEQIRINYDEMFTQARSRVSRGEPVVLYLWTPSQYAEQLTPGDNVIWLQVENVLDDSNPLDSPDGAGHDQRPGTARVPPAACPSAIRGTCQLGWLTLD